MGTLATRSLFALFVLLAAVAAPRSGHAAQKLAVAEMHAPQNLSGIAAKLTQDIVDTASRQADTTVLDPFAVEKALGPEAIKNLKACSGSASCVTRWAAGLGVDRIVVGSLDRSEASYLVKLYLVDLKAKQVVSTVDRSILIASRRLQADVSAAIPGLLAGKAEAKGQIAIATTSPNATLFFDGELVGKTPVTVEAKPGKHTIKLTKDGFLPVERFVTVEEGTTEKVTLTLIAIPGAKTLEDDLPTIAQKAQEEAAAASGSGVNIPALTWVGGGVAVASIALAIGLGVDANSKANAAGNGPVYGISRTDALAGKRNAMLSNVFWGVAGAGAVTAVLSALLWPKDAPPADKKNDGAPAPNASLAPIEGGAAVTLSGSF
ncbi:MAG: PEGA domain-containing protein [Myxococcales bacterium]